MPRIPTAEERLDSLREDMSKKILQHRRERRILSRVSQGFSYTTAKAREKKRWTPVDWLFGLSEAFFDSLHPDKERNLIRWPDSILWRNSRRAHGKDIVGDGAVLAGGSAADGRAPEGTGDASTLSLPEEEGASQADEPCDAGQGRGENVPPAVG